MRKSSHLFEDYVYLYMNLTAFITTVNCDEQTSTELTQMNCDEQNRTEFTQMNCDEQNRTEFTQMNCEYELTLLAIK